MSILQQIVSLTPKLGLFGIVGAAACVLGAAAGQLLLPPEEEPPPPPPPPTAAIVMLLDTSSSMRGEPLAEVKAAAINFVEKENLELNQIALIDFNKRTTIHQPFTNDRGALINSISGLEAGGDTIMSQALEDSLSLLHESTDDKLHVLLFTDGQPRVGDHEATIAAAENVRNADVNIIAIASGYSNLRFLEQVTDNPEQTLETEQGEFLAAFTEAQAIIEESIKVEGIFGTTSTSEKDIFRDALILSAIIALFLSTFLLVAENTLSLGSRWWQGIPWIPIGAMILGSLGGFLGESFHNFTEGSRSAGWTILGGAIGGMLGLSDRSRIKTLRGILGGLIGGLLGGVLFEALLSSNAEGSAVNLRLYGFAVLGFAIGLMIMFTQEIFKDAWLLGTTTGTYEGKQYILAKPIVTVGRTGKNDISLFQEKDLPKVAGQFESEKGEWLWSAVDSGAGVKVNGIVQEQAALTSGDRLRFGGTEFIFKLRGHEESKAKDMSWIFRGNDQDYPIPKKRRASIGKAQNNDVVISDDSVAGKHAILTFSNQGLKLQSLGLNTSVNGTPLKVLNSRLLRRGDFIVLGKVELALVVDVAADQ